MPEGVPGRAGRPRSSPHDQQASWLQVTQALADQVPKTSHHTVAHDSGPDTTADDEPDPGRLVGGCRPFTAATGWQQVQHHRRS